MQCTVYCPFREGHLEYCDPYVFWVVTCELRNKTEVYRSRVMHDTGAKCLVPPVELKGFLLDVQADIEQVMKDVDADIDAVAAQKEEEGERWPRA